MNDATNCWSDVSELISAFHNFFNKVCSGWTLGCFPLERNLEVAWHGGVSMEKWRRNASVVLNLYLLENKIPLIKGKAWPTCQSNIFPNAPESLNANLLPKVMLKRYYPGCNVKYSRV